MPYFLTRGRGLSGRRRRTRGCGSRACSYPPTSATSITPRDSMRAHRKMEGPGDFDHLVAQQPDMLALSYPLMFPTMGHWDYDDSLSCSTFAVKRPRQPSASSTVAASEPIDIPQSPKDELSWSDFTNAESDGFIVGSCYSSAWSTCIPRTGETTDTRPAYMIKWENSFRRNSEQAALRGEPHPGIPQDSDMDDDTTQDLSVEVGDDLAYDHIFEMDLEM